MATVLSSLVRLWMVSPVGLRVPGSGILQAKQRSPAETHHPRPFAQASRTHQTPGPQAATPGQRCRLKWAWMHRATFSDVKSSSSMAGKETLISWTSDSNLSSTRESSAICSVRGYAAWASDSSVAKCEGRFGPPPSSQHKFPTCVGQRIENGSHLGASLRQRLSARSRNGIGRYQGVVSQGGGKSPQHLLVGPPHEGASRGETALKSCPVAPHSHKFLDERHLRTRR
ncbi:unnamed protein product [Lampetra fluviatilis]